MTPGFTGAIFDVDGVLAVSLSGLTRVELAFALVLAAASTGLVLGLGLAEPGPRSR